MVYKALTFCADNVYERLKPLYDAEVERGNLKIIAHADMEKDKIKLVYADGKPGGGEMIFQTSISRLFLRTGIFMSA